MGAIGGGIGKGVGQVGGLVNGILSPFGLGGEQGDYYSPDASSLNALKNFVYANEYKKNPETEGVEGTQIATDQIRNNPLLSSLFGEGGLQSRLNDEEKQLSSQGFKLTPEDMTAYGQTSGNIANMFGNQEQQAAQSLAKRGLASASSGASGALFSGLAGNKNEMLARAQTDVAQKRYQDTVQRLQGTRNQMQSLGAQASGDINDQFNRQLSGRQQRYNEFSGLAGLQDKQNSQNLASMTDRRGAKGKTLFDAAGQGLYSGVTEAGKSAPKALFGA